MVVKIENTDFWVTPGLYQNNRQFIKQGLDSIANSYGIKISTPELKGVFTLKREVNQKSSISIRNVFRVELISGTLKNPVGVEEIKWLSIDEALKQITFPHINHMIKQVVQNPEILWGGSILQYKEGDKFKSKILEEFYPMLHTDKSKR